MKIYISSPNSADNTPCFFYQTLKQNTEHFTRLVLLMMPLKGAPINNLFSVKHYYYEVTENNFVLENVCMYFVQCLPLKKIEF